MIIKEARFAEEDKPFIRPNCIGYSLYMLYDSSGTLSQIIAGISVAHSQNRFMTGSLTRRSQL